MLSLGISYQSMLNLGLILDIKEKKTLKFNIIIIITKLLNFTMLTANNKQMSILTEVNLAKNI
jgi:hypothetical protein